MNRSFRDYAAPGFGSARNSSMQPALSHSHHRRGNSLVASRDSSSDDKLDLFSRSRRSVSLPSDDDPDVSLNLAKISVAKSVRNGLDDLLTSAEDGKHDYDWLLTPPETPLNSTIEGNGFQQKRAAPRSSSVSRSATTTKSSSRLSVVAPDHSNICSRSARSSSVTRPSISYTPSSSMMSSSMIRSSSNNILNTSSASVSSYVRPSSPMSRSSSSTARSSTPCRSSPSSRQSTPSKVRSSPSLSSSSSTDIVKPRSSVSSRPSTPTSSRPQISSNITPTPTLISSSRPSTPNRRSSISGVANLNLSVSTRRVSSNGRSSGQSSTSRPSSPSPRIRSHHQQQTAVLPSDFSLDTPPNLRTTLPDRPISAGRSRPSASASTTAAKLTSESQGSAGVARRSASPAVSRGRSNFMEPPQGGSGRSTRVSSNGHNTNDIHDPKRSMYVSESQQGRRSAKGPTPTDHVNGFGRTISKKSLDMAIRHMDIRSGPGGTRPVSGTVLYPQSIRSMASSRTQSGHASSGNNLSYNSSSSSSSQLNLTLLSSFSNGSSISENGRYYDNGSLVNRTGEDNYSSSSSSNNMGSSNGGFFGRVSEVDMFESSRYDALLLKEDAKNTNWLHGGDGMSDEGLIFDNGLESLPEPFGLS